MTNILPIGASIIFVFVFGYILGNINGFTDGVNSTMTELISEPLSPSVLFLKDMYVLTEETDEYYRMECITTY